MPNAARLSTAVLAACLLLPAGCQLAAARSLVDVDLIDRDSGYTLPEYSARGDIFVPGEPGRRYSVRLSNQSGERVLVVLSVDGVNAVTGQTASPAQAGYVLEPWETADIDGWRKSMDDIAQFYFTDLPDSYAARTGRPGNVGVVGIAVFREREVRVYPRPYPRPYPMPSPPWSRSGHAEEAASAPSASAEAAGDAAAPQSSAPYGGSSARQRVGTGHGAREWSPTQYTSFIRASSRPVQVLELRYESPQALSAMGIVPYPYDRRDVRPGEPRAFPNGLVPDPPGW